MRQIAEMEKHERLREARLKAGFESAADAARRLNVPYGTYSGHENGSRGIKDRELFKYSKVFKVSPTWLLFGTEKDESDLEFCELMGVGGHLPNGEIELYDEDEAEGEILAQHTILKNTAYIRVTGKYLRGIAEENWVIFADSDLSSPRNIKPGTLCICLLHDKTCLCRFIYPTDKPGLFDLESPLYGTERGVNVIGASEVYMIATEVTVDLMRQLAATVLSEVGLVQHDRQPTSK